MAVSSWKHKKHITHFDSIYLCKEDFEAEGRRPQHHSHHIEETNNSTGIVQKPVNFPPRKRSIPYGKKTKPAFLFIKFFKFDKNKLLKCMMNFYRKILHVKIFMLKKFFVQCQSWKAPFGLLSLFFLYLCVWWHLFIAWYFKQYNV